MTRFPDRTNRIITALALGFIVLAMMILASGVLD